MTENVSAEEGANQKHPVSPHHDARGKFARGNLANPGGKKATGYQDGRTRYRFLSENYTVEEIDAMVMNKKPRRKLLHRDAVLLEQLSVSVLQVGKQAMARGYTAEQIIKERHFCIEQLIGKAAITLRHGGAPEHGPVEFARAPSTPEEGRIAYQTARQRAVKYTENATDAEFTEVAPEAALPSPEKQKE